MMDGSCILPRFGPNREASVFGNARNVTRAIRISSLRKRPVRNAKRPLLFGRQKKPVSLVGAGPCLHPSTQF